MEQKILTENAMLGLAFKNHTTRHNVIQLVITR
jgi:hypothetical protein